MNNDFSPKIVSLLCKWCASTGADLAGTSRLKYSSSILPIRVMCSSRVNPVSLIVSYFKGADGILVSG